MMLKILKSTKINKNFNLEIKTKGDGMSSFLVVNRFLFYNIISEIVYYKILDCLNYGFKFFCVYDIKFVPLCFFETA